MRQRILELGGHLEVDSDGQGTCITAIMPLTKGVAVAPLPATNDQLSVAAPVDRAS